MPTSLEQHPQPSITGEDWITQTALLARALAAIAPLAGGAILVFSDWSVTGLPPQFWIALIWAAPCPIYFALSFFVRRLHGQICRVLYLLTTAHAIATLAAPLLLGNHFTVASFPQFMKILILDPRQAISWYLLLALGLAAGMANLIVSAYWSRKYLSNPQTLSRVRGFEVIQH